MNRNIGIFAHIDAGKTTLSEQLLVTTGAVKAGGSVDTGTAHTDTLPVERRRGISVKAACVSMDYQGTRINLIDTPGHADFSAEIERSLWALDGAVLTLCGVEGVQPQTEVLFEALRNDHMPFLFFINKMDREGADAEAVLRDIHRTLTPCAAFLTDTAGMLTALCEVDEDILSRYLDDEDIPAAEIEAAFLTHARLGHVYPVLTGSAQKATGIRELLSAMVEYIPEPRDTGDLCGVIFAAQQDKTLGRGVWVRLFGGELKNRDAVSLPAGRNAESGEEQTVQLKVSQILDDAGKPLGKLSAGDIGVVYGLGSAPIGHVLGSRSALPRRVEAGSLRAPLMTVQVIPDDMGRMNDLRAAAEILSGEDPLLGVKFIPALNELHLGVMGKIQLEVLEEVFLTRFDLKVTFSPPAIIYRETIRQAAEGFVAYTMPKPCWAVLKFLIEPGEVGSGVVYESKVPVRDVMTRYQHQVAQAIPLALKQGRLGWQVTDVKITLTFGEQHLVHTHPLDFIVATPMAIHDGLHRGGSQLLEPILGLKLRIPAECTGRVMSDINLMRGEVTDTRAEGDRVILTAQVPVKTSLDYAVTLAQVTGGRGTMTAKLFGYRPCDTELGATAKRRSIDPLDQSAYILAARSALDGGIFDEDTF